MSKEIYINFLDYYLPKKIENNLSILQKNFKTKKDSLKMIKKIGLFNQEFILPMILLRQIF